MIICQNIDELRKAISGLKNSSSGAVLGFVPTMGALHAGHLSLVKKAAECCDIVVVSIFVNPTQFNDKKDLDKYPRTIDSDIEKLQTTACNIVFVPSEKEIYPSGKPKYQIDLNGLDQVMEGKYRPGHFDGVAMVVERFFDIVKPDKAFFGLKDFQQLAIIKQMVKVRKLDVEIVPVEIARSENGLALSSRNQLLTQDQKEDALIIYKTLMVGKEMADNNLPVEKILATMRSFFDQGNLKLEYIEIVDPRILQTVKNAQSPMHCCIAAYCGSVRLIDNMQFS